ncbi:lactose-binding lectin l-2-like isoform X2 [Tachysurus vachellii]|uniref:lactose-binding lectin l-2-like isoform X2 n=1 Tax=Tachysurus vachellii TaxID=175792 RepID=UPI00296ADE78|nr:lactose-binding lectin l-2-like isoform X2 [Tachysurus vachellii]XP_060731116.1 lactose-binding lectin l-2-like isoform X2 [Tachysurus vachellii]
MASQTKVVMLLILATAGAALADHHIVKVKGAISKNCPTGWTSYSGRCYLYNAAKLDWVSAETFCQKFDAHLVSIHSENQYQQIKALIRRHDPTENPTYIGLSDCQKPNQFFWSDGTKLTFTKWNPGEPNNVNNGERCVNMNWPSYSSDKNWNDIPCDQPYASVCAKKSG